MRVKIGDTWHDSENEPITAIVTQGEMELLFDNHLMYKTFSSVCSCPPGHFESDEASSRWTFPEYWKKRDAGESNLPPVDYNLV